MRSKYWSAPPIWSGQRCFVIAGVYETIQPVEFKKGEEIEVDPSALSRADQESLGIAKAATDSAPKKGKGRGKHSSEAELHHGASDLAE